ncbi:hypothetical protein EAL2_c20830 [Peptoclostridium acidaminophilum DSM 3953]|uniref:Uncharacterized protein n=1 Tax=Peptoclostridium acidaminophilum DSM 3953 TaxID=1286171 RepID=W8T6I8_PEPAC|nr:hypothetical protein [Peptoclostridium acidaminophilum]AHM57364.1 hypothetical protein EAL2_c20830 [Peptoclostridium acidaminophilum DSM 3953]
MNWMTFIDGLKTKAKDMLKAKKIDIKAGAKSGKDVKTKDMGKVIYVDFTAPRKAAYTQEKLKKPV